MAGRERPLSPFLIYRFEYTMLWSFTHRVTGVFLSIGSIALAWWLLALARGPEAYARTMDTFDSLLMRALLLGALFAFFFHLANGIRHLVWDCGLGFEKAQARASAWLVLVVAVVLTALCAFAIWRPLGGTA
ncbi:MAG TPA: succinate dehydrogenase, cytochrome b556 subunit [Steroidobacteraceae bacterium]|nr:succinate dehydrogenase, cytochrome b556 subunit [Steroidobacteraceae bacterium]